MVAVVAFVASARPVGDGDGQHSSALLLSFCLSFFFFFFLSSACGSNIKYSNVTTPVKSDSRSKSFTTESNNEKEITRNDTSVSHK